MWCFSFSYMHSFIWNYLFFALLKIPLLRYDARSIISWLFKVVCVWQHSFGYNVLWARFQINNHFSLDTPSFAPFSLSPSFYSSLILAPFPFSVKNKYGGQFSIFPPTSLFPSICLQFIVIATSTEFMSNSFSAEDVRDLLSKISRLEEVKAPL